MKTIIVVDGADNCAYDCFTLDDRFFALLYPGEGQDIELIKDVLERYPGGELDEHFRTLCENNIQRANVQGIDGILFYELLLKKKFYPNKRHAELEHYSRFPVDV